MPNIIPPRAAMTHKLGSPNRTQLDATIPSSKSRTRGPSPGPQAPRAPEWPRGGRAPYASSRTRKKCYDALKCTVRKGSQ